MTGKRSGTSRRPGTLLLVLAALSAPIVADAEPLDSYLIPGIDIRQADFRKGSWARYLVVDEAEGYADTSVVYVAVLESGPDGIWMELATRPAQAGIEDQDVTRVLLSHEIRSLAAGDSLYHYVREMYIQRGSEPARPADPRDLKRLTLTDPTSDADWIHSSGVPVRTPGGDFVCVLRELTMESSHETPTGRVTVVQHRRDEFSVWSSTDIPVFGLARCEIKRMRESRTVPPLQGIPQSGPRTSLVTSQLIASGQGASELMSPERGEARSPVDKR